MTRSPRLVHASLAIDTAKTLPQTERMFRLFILVLSLLAGNLRAADGIAIAIVIDTSGSMLAAAPGKDGAAVQKWQIARSALSAVSGKIADFTKTGAKPVQLALFAFDGKKSARELVALAPFDAAKLAEKMPGRESIEGGTPLGAATEAAANALLKAKADARHVIVITDGENTVGPKPETVIAALDAVALKAGKPVQYHFLAFDVDAAVFAGVKKTGASVASAANEIQLRAKLDNLLEERILLEKD